MNRILILSSMFLIASVEISAMDGKLIVHRPESSFFHNHGSHSSSVEIDNDANIFSTDNIEKTESSTHYKLPLNFAGFERGDLLVFDKTFNTIKKSLEPFDITLELKKTQNELVIFFLQTTVSPIDPKHKEVRLPFYEIKMPIGPNNLEKNDNKDLINKRLQELKKRAFSFIKNGELRAKALDDYRKSITFADKINFMLLHNVKPKVENSLLKNIIATLALPFTQAIENALTTNPIAVEEREINELTQKIEAEEPALNKILDLTNAQRKLAKLAKKDDVDPIKLKTREKEFINKFEDAILLAE